MARGYKRAIVEGRLDDVLRDMAIHVWRHDARLDEVPAATLEDVDEFFDRIHNCIVSGAEDDALLLLDQLQEDLLSFEA